MKPPICPNCRYDLRGLDDSSRHCPECGTEVEFEPVRIRARPLTMPLQLNYLRAIATTCVAVLGWALLTGGRGGGFLLCILVIAAAVFVMELYDWRKASRLEPNGSQWQCMLITTTKGLRIIHEADDAHNCCEELLRWDEMAPVRSEWYGPGRSVLRVSSRDHGMHDANRRRYVIAAAEETANAIAKQMNWLIDCARIRSREEMIEA